MNTIKLNDTIFELINFSKNTSFKDNTVRSVGGLSIKATDITPLISISQDTINKIEIYHGEDLVYTLNNANCKIMNIEEFFNNETVSINVNLEFNFSVSESEEEE